MARPLPSRRRPLVINDDDSSDDDGEFWELTPQKLAAAADAAAQLELAAAVAAAAQRTQPTTAPAADHISTPVAGPSAEPPPTPTTPSKTKTQALRDSKASSYGDKVRTQKAARQFSHGAGHSYRKQEEAAKEWERHRIEELTSPTPTPSQAARPSHFILDPNAMDSSNYSSAMDQESTLALHSGLVLAPSDQVPKGPIQEHEDSPLVLSASVCASKSSDKCVPNNQEGEILYARRSQGETQPLSSLDAARPKSRVPPKMAWKALHSYLPPNGASSQSPPSPLDLNLLEFRAEWDTPIRPSPSAWYQHQPNTTTPLVSPRDMYPDSPVSAAAVMHDLFTEASLAGPRGTTLTEINPNAAVRGALPEPQGSPGPSYPPSPAESDDDHTYAESQSEDDSYATMSSSTPSPTRTPDPELATPVPSRRSNRTRRTLHSPEPRVEHTPMPRPRRFPSAAEVTQSMHRHVQVRPQPGMGLGLQVTGGDVEKSELVAFMLALSVYSPQRQPELITAGHTDGQYAMKGAECILDARKAIGLCAGNETTDGPPSLTVVGVRIPNAHDDTDDMVLVAFANRAIKEGEFPSLCYGDEFGRDHYPDGGKSIRMDVPALAMNEEDMLLKVMDHLACCDPEVRAYASFKAWGPTEERICQEVVELSPTSPTLPSNMTQDSYAEETTLESASTSKADRTPGSRHVVPSDADPSIDRPRTLGVKSLETLAREANQAIIKACEPGGVLHEHGLTCQIFTGPDLCGRPRFEVTIPEHAFVRCKYDAASISVTVPSDATGNRESCGKMYACVVEIAPLNSDQTLLDGSFETLFNGAEPKARPRHPLMKEGTDQVRRFCCPERVEEMIYWIHAFCMADEDKAYFDLDMSEEMRRLYQGLAWETDYRQASRVTREYRRAARGLQAGAERDEWKKVFRGVLVELTYNAWAKNVTSDVLLSLSDGAQRLEIGAERIEASRAPSPPPSPAAEERPVGPRAFRATRRETDGAQGQQDPHLCWRYVGTEKDPHLCWRYEFMTDAARLNQKEWLRQLRQRPPLDCNENPSDGLEDPIRNTDDRDVALDDRQKHDAINLADGPPPDPNEPNRETTTPSCEFCQFQPNAQEESPLLSVAEWWKWMKCSFDGPEPRSESIELRSRRISLLTQFNVVSKLEGYELKWGQAAVHFKDTVKRHAALQDEATANGAARIALSACSAALMVLIARVLGRWRNGNPCNGASLEEDQEYATRWLQRLPPPEEPVVSPPPSPPSQRSSKGKASQQSSQPSRPSSSSRSTLSKFESMRIGVDDDKREAIGLGRRDKREGEIRLGFLESKKEYLQRQGLREMPKGAQIIRTWDGSLEDVALKPTQTHWSQTSMAPELRRLGPDRAREVLDSWREAYIHLNLYEPCSMSEDVSKQRQDRIFHDRYLSHGPTYDQYLRETAASCTHPNPGDPLHAPQGQYVSTKGRSQASTSTPPRAPSSPPQPDRARQLKQGGTLLEGDSLGHQTWPGPGFKGKQKTEPADTLTEPGVPFWGCVNEACPCPASHDGQKNRHCCRTCQAGRPCTKPFHVVPFSRPRPQTEGTFHGCVDPNCPCPASFNGQPAEHCCRKCQDGEPCRQPYHKTPEWGWTPKQPPRKPLRRVRDFEVIRQAKSGLQKGEDVDLWEVRFEDSPNQLFVTRLQPSDYQAWHEGERCPLPTMDDVRLSRPGTAVDDMRYYLPWTTSRPLPWPKEKCIPASRSNRSSGPSKPPPPSPPPSPPPAQRREPIGEKADVIYFVAGRWYPPPTPKSDKPIPGAARAHSHGRDDTAPMAHVKRIDISNEVQRAKEESLYGKAVSHHLSRQNLHSVMQDSQGARCFSCAGWPHIDRCVEVLKDGTVICPDCGVDAVVPASKVYSEAELHAWRYLAFYYSCPPSKGKSKVQPPAKEDAKKQEDTARLYSSDPSESNHQYALRLADSAAEFKIAGLRTCTKYAKYLDEVTACNAEPRIEHLMEQINLSTDGDAATYVAEAFNAKKAMYTDAQWQDMASQRTAWLNKTRPRGAGLWRNTEPVPKETRDHAKSVGRKGPQANSKDGAECSKPDSHHHSRETSQSCPVAAAMAVFSCTREPEASLHPLYDQKDFKRSCGNAKPPLSDGEKGPSSYRPPNGTHAERSKANRAHSQPGFQTQPPSQQTTSILCESVDWETISRNVPLGETPAEFAGRLTRVYWVRLYNQVLKPANDPPKSPQSSRKELFDRSNEIAQKFYECMTKEKKDRHPKVEALNLRLIARFREVWGARFHDREACPAERRCGPPSLTGLLQEWIWSVGKDPFPYGLVIPDNRRCPHWREMYLQRTTDKCRPCSRPNDDPRRSKSRGLPPSPPPSPPPTEATSLVKATPPTLLEVWTRSYPTVDKALAVVQSDRGPVSKANELWKLATQGLFGQSTLPYQKLATSAGDVEVGEPAPPRDQLYPDPPAGPPEDGVHARDDNGKGREPPTAAAINLDKDQSVPRRSGPCNGCHKPQDSLERCLICDRALCDKCLPQGRHECDSIAVDKVQARSAASRPKDCTSCGKSNTARCTGISTTDPGCYRGLCCQPNPLCEFCRYGDAVLFPVCSVGSELALAECPKERCARCVANGDPTGKNIADYYKCGGSNSQCERRCCCKDARSSGLQSCNGCSVKYCSVHARAKRSGDCPSDIAGHKCHGKHLATETNVVEHLVSNSNAAAAALAVASIAPPLQPLPPVAPLYIPALYIPTLTLWGASTLIPQAAAVVAPAVVTSPNMADRDRSGPCKECRSPQDSRTPCPSCNQLLCKKCLPQEMHGYCADTLQPLESKRTATGPEGETLEGFVRETIQRRMGGQELTPVKDDCTELPPPSSPPPASPQPSPPASPIPGDDARRAEEPPPEETAAQTLPPLPDPIGQASETTPVHEPPVLQPVAVTAPLVAPIPLAAAGPSTVEPAPPNVMQATEEPRPRELATPRLPEGPPGTEVSEVETTIRPARLMTAGESGPHLEPTQTVMPLGGTEVQSPAYGDYVPFESVAPNVPLQGETISREQRTHEMTEAGIVMTEMRDLMAMLRAERDAAEAAAQSQAGRAARPQYGPPPPPRSESPQRQRQREDDEGQEEIPEQRGQLQLRTTDHWERESEPERRSSQRNRDSDEPRYSSSRPGHEPDRPARCTSNRTYADPPESVTHPRGPPRSSHCAATRWQEAPSEGLNVEENLPRPVDGPRQTGWDAPRYPGGSRGQNFDQSRRRTALDGLDEEDTRSVASCRSEVSELRDSRHDQTHGGSYTRRSSDRDHEGGQEEEREARRHEKVGAYLDLFHQEHETTLEALHRSPECETIREVLASKADNRGEHWNARAFWVEDVISSWAYKYMTTRSEKAVNENLRNLEKIRFPAQLRDQDEQVLGATWEEYRGDLITTWRDCLRAGCAWEHMLQRILNSAKNKTRGGNNPRVESLVRKALSDPVMYNNDLRNGGGYALLHADTLLWQLDESYATAHHGPQAASNAWGRCTQFEEGETIVTLGGRVLTTYSKFIGMEEDVIHLDDHHRSVLFVRVGKCLRNHKNKELGQALYCAWEDGVKYCKEAVRAKLMNKTNVTVDLILRMHVDSKKSLLGFLADKHTPERRPREKAPPALAYVEPRRSARLRREEVNAVNAGDHDEDSEDVAQPAAAVSPSGANEFSRVPPPHARMEGRGLQMTEHERRWGRECTHPAGNKGHPTGKQWDALEWRRCTIDYNQVIKLANDPRFQKLMCRVLPMTKEMSSCRKDIPRKIDGAWGPQACTFCPNRPTNESTAWKSGDPRTGAGSHVPTTCRTLKRFLAEGGDAQHAPMRQELQKCLFFRKYEPPGHEQKVSDRPRPRESDRR